jgi:hypothetical protein
MTSQRMEGIEIDRCMTCDGIWLDAGEYEAVRHRIAVERPSDGGSQETRPVGAGGPVEFVFDLVSLLLEFWH